MNQLTKQKLLERAETAFLVLFLIYTILGFNSITYATPIISVMMWVSYSLGGLLLLARLWNWKHYLKTPGLILLAAMCVICVISIVLNLQYDLKNNIVYLIFWAFYFFLFYAQSDQTTAEMAKKRLHIAGHILNMSAFILAAISLGMMACGYSEILEIQGSEVIRGFTHGRLYGTYLTPNAGAVVASIAILLSVYFIRKYKKAAYTVFAAANILVQFLYIVFSDSRSGTLCLTFSAAVYVFFTVALSTRLKGLKWRKAIIILLVVVTAVCAFFAPSVAQDTYNSIATEISENATNDTDNEVIDIPVVDRGYDLSGDISNRRFDVWKSGLEVFAERPWFGLTFKGFLPYAIENLPETYIVSNDHRQMDTLDNDFLNLLVSNGIFALLAFVAFVVWILVYLFRYVFVSKHRDPAIPLMMGICASAAVFSMFTSGVLYMRSPFSILFWLCLGNMTAIVSKGEKENSDA